MKKIAGKTKRFLSIFMALMMIVSVIPASSLNVYAEEIVTEESENTAIASEGVIIDNARADVNSEKGRSEAGSVDNTSDKNIDDASQKNIGDASEKNIDDASEKNIDDASDVTIGDASDGTIDDATEEAINESSEEVVDESVEATTEEAMLADGAPISLSWDSENPGCVIVTINSNIDSLSEIEFHLVKEGTNDAIDSNTINQGAVEAGDVKSLSFIRSIKDSGKYRVSASVDGVEYVTEWWDYTRPDTAFTTPKNIRVICDKAGKPTHIVFEVEEDGSGIANISITNLDNNVKRSGEIYYNCYNLPNSPYSDSSNISTLDLEAYENTYHFYDAIKDNSGFKVEVYLYGNAYNDPITQKAVGETATAKFSWVDNDQLISIDWQKDNKGIGTGYALLKFAKVPENGNAHVSLCVDMTSSSPYKLEVGDVACTDEDLENGIVLDLRKYMIPINSHDGFYDSYNVCVEADGKSYLSSVLKVYQSSDTKCVTPSDIRWQKDESGKPISISWKVGYEAYDDYDYCGTVTNLTTGTKREFVVGYDSKVADGRMTYVFTEEFAEGLITEKSKYEVSLVACSSLGVMKRNSSNEVRSIYNWNGISNAEPLEAKIDGGVLSLCLFSIPENNSIKITINRDGSFVRDYDVEDITSEYLYAIHRFDFRGNLAVAGSYSATIIIDGVSYTSNSWTYSSVPEEYADIPYDFRWEKDGDGNLLGISWSTNDGDETLGEITNINTQATKSFEVLAENQINGRSMIIFDDEYSDIIKKDEVLLVRLIAVPSVSRLDDVLFSGTFDSSFDWSKSEFAQNVTINWGTPIKEGDVQDKTFDGYATITFNIRPQNKNIRFLLTDYKAGKVLVEEIIKYEPWGATTLLDLRQYFTQSGNYSMSLYVDDTCIESDTLKFTRTESSLPKPENFVWTCDKNGIPQRINYDVDFTDYLSTFDEDELDSIRRQTYTFCYSLTNLSTCQKRSGSYIDSIYWNGDSFSSGISFDFAQAILKGRNDYKFEAYFIFGDDLDGVGKTGVSEHIYSAPVIAGPQDLNFDVKTGELSFTTGDVSDGNDNLNYSFNLYKVSDYYGEFIKYIPVEVENSGEEKTISFAGLYSKTGKYAIKISASKKNEDGSTLYETKDTIEFEYVTPKKKVSTPSKVTVSGTVVRWDDVEDENGYQVKVDYVDSTGSKLHYYFKTEKDTNYVDIGIFASEKYNDVMVSVCAISEDATVTAVSDYSTPVEYKYVVDKNVSLKWNEQNDGNVIGWLEDWPMGDYCTFYLERVDTGKIIVQEEYDVNRFVNWEKYIDVSIYLTESGKYRAGLKVDGIVTYTSIWDYVLPEKKTPTVENVQWIFDTENNPIGLTWDIGDYYSESYFEYKVQFSAAYNNIVPEYISINSDMNKVKAEDGKVIYSFRNDINDLLYKDDVITAKIVTKPKDINIEEEREGEPAVISCEWGTAKTIPAEPAKVEFNSKTGMLYITNGDTYDPNSCAWYGVYVMCDGKPVHSARVDFGEIGNTISVSLVRAFDETGEYEISVKLNYMKSNDDITSKYDKRLTVEHHKAETRLAAPTNVTLTGSIASWDNVENAQGYDVLLIIRETEKYDSNVITLCTDTNSIDLQEYIDKYDEFDFEVYSIPEDINTYAISYQSQIVTFARVVALKWNPNGQIEGTILRTPNDSSCTITVYENRTVKGTWKDTFDEYELNEMKFTESFARYIDKTADYQVVYTVDGQDYSTPVWEYVKPTITCPIPTDIKWELDENDKPTGVSWACSEGLNEDFHYELYIKELGNSEWNRGYSIYKDDEYSYENGRIKYILPSYEDCTFGENKKYELSIYGVSHNLNKLLSINPVYSQYEFGTATGIPVGPKNVQFDKTNGLLTYTCGDAIDDKEVIYQFRLYKDNRSIITWRWNTAGIDEATTLYLLGYYFESGDYSIEVSTRWSENGVDFSSFNETIDFSYELPQQKISAPSTVWYEGSVLKWNKVNEADSYIVKAEFDYDFQGKEMHRTFVTAALYSNYFDIASLLGSSGCRNMSCSVYAVPADVTKVAPSDYSASVDYIATTDAKAKVEWALSKDGNVKCELLETCDDEEIDVVLERLDTDKILSTMQISRDYLIEIGEIYFDFAKHINESGAYRAYAIVDGVKYYTTVWQYKLPDKTTPAVTNIEWLTDDDGKPYAISWDMGDYFDETDYHYNLELKARFYNIDQSLYVNNWNDNAVVEGGKITYYLPEYLKESMYIDDLYTVFITTNQKGSLEDDRPGAPAESTYEWGIAQEVPLGPTDLKFDSKTGVLTFTSRDDSTEDRSVYYAFSVFKDGVFLSSFSKEPGKKGEEGQANIGGNLTETGTYNVVVYAMHSIGAGYYSPSSREDFDIEYTKPDTAISVPENVRFSGTTLTWDKVDDAQGYVVVLDYIWAGETKSLVNKMYVLSNSADLSYYAGSSDVLSAYVRAVPNDLSVKAVSENSEPVNFEKKYYFSNNVSKLTLNDDKNSTADIHLVDSKGAKVSGVTYASADKSVVTVDSNGIIKAVGEGRTVISATPKGAKTGYSFSVWVVKEIYAIGFMDASTKTLTDSDNTDTIVVVPTPTDISIKSIGFTVSDTKYLEVEKDTSDETGRTYKVKAVDLDEFTGEKEVSVIFTVYDNSGKSVTNIKKYNLVAKEEVPSLEGYSGYSYAAADKTLQQVRIIGPNNELSLPEGWEWASPTLDITKYSGQESAFFVVKYEKKTGEMLYENIKVIFDTPDSSKQTFEGIPSTMCVGDVISDVSLKDEEPDVLFKDYTVISSSNKILAVTKSEDNLFTFTAKAKGTATLTYKVSGVTVATKKITIVAGNCLEGDILYSLYDGDGQKKENLDDLEVVYTDEALSNIYFIKNDIEDFSMNVTSSDTSIMKVIGGSKLIGDNQLARLEFVGAGDVYVIFTVNDAVKATTRLKIHVVDRSKAEKVVLSKSTVTFNTAKKDEFIDDTITVFNDGERKLNGAALFETKCFDKNNKVKAEYDENLLVVSTITIGFNSESNEVTFKPATGAMADVKAGKYMLGLSFEEDKKIYTPVTVKLTNSAPAFTIKQVENLDKAFVQDSDNAARFDITGSTDITGVEIVGLQAVSEGTGDFSLDDSKKSLRIWNFNGNKNLEVRLFTDEYKPVSVKITPKTTTTKFALSSTTGTYYTDVADSYPRIGITKGTNKEVYNLSLKDGAEARIDNVSGYKVDIENGMLVIKPNEEVTQKSSEKLTIKVKCDELAGELTFTYTVKTSVLNKAKLALGAKSLTMYNYAGENAVVSTTLKLAGNSIPTSLMENVVISEKVNSKLGASYNQTLNVTYNPETGLVEISKASDRLKAGTYNYVFKLTENGKTISATLPVKVINITGATKKTSASVKIAAKNSINVLDRESTYAKITAKFTNVPSSAKKSIDRIAGKDSDKFYAVGNNVYLKNDATVMEKENYEIQLIYRVEANGAEIYVTSNVIKLSFKNAKSKVTIKDGGSSIFKKSADSKSVELAAVVNSKNISIDRVELANMKDSFNLEKTDEGMVLNYTPCGKTQLGKTYTLKFNVYLAGAPKNAKPVTVSYKVKIAK